MEETKNKAAPVIRLQDVRKEYVVGDSHIHALDGVSLTVSPGEFVCISGRSGSGKSTMLNMLAGLEKPTSGEIVILDKHIENMSESARIRFRRQYIGFVFQSYNLMPQYTAVENVELPLMLRGMGQKEHESAESRRLPSWSRSALSPMRSISRRNCPAVSSRESALRGRSLQSRPSSLPMS